MRKVRKSPIIILLLINIYKIVINEKNEILLIIEVKAVNYYNYASFDEKNNNYIDNDKLSKHSLCGVYYLKWNVHK